MTGTTCVVACVDFPFVARARGAVTSIKCAAQFKGILKGGEKGVCVAVAAWRFCPDPGGRVVTVAGAPQRGGDAGQSDTATVR